MKFSTPFQIQISFCLNQLLTSKGQERIPQNAHVARVKPRGQVHGVFSARPRVVERRVARQRSRPRGSKRQEGKG